MSKPVDAFFLGRALAETVNKEIEKTLTNALSELGKFDAEQREKLREFTEQVLQRAQAEAENGMQGRTITVNNGTETGDLQAVIDELRAEIARLRAELQQYRSQKVS